MSLSLITFFDEWFTPILVFSLLALLLYRIYGFFKTFTKQACSLVMDLVLQASLNTILVVLIGMLIKNGWPIVSMHELKEYFLIGEQWFWTHAPYPFAGRVIQTISNTNSDTWTTYLMRWIK